MIDPQLDNRVVLITGANHGIGAATARAFSAQGSRVCLTYYRGPAHHTAEAYAHAIETGIGGPVLYEARQQQPIEPLVRELQEAGISVTAWEADLGDPGAIEALFDRCETEVGPVEVLVNNHTHCVLETFDPGLVTDEGFGIHTVTARVIDRHFAVNARAYALLMMEYVRRALARGARWGRIINLSTDAAHAHVANVSYAASKHAIESYSRSAAAELGKYGITVNIVAPGPIQTGYLRPEQEAEITTGTPLGRVGLPSDVAEVIVFLASAQAHWLTGQLLYVGGGWRMSQ